MIINNFFRTVAVSNNHNPAGLFTFPSVTATGNIFKFRRIEVSEVALLLTREQYTPDAHLCSNYKITG